MVILTAMQNLVTKSIEIVGDGWRAAGLKKIGKACGVSYQSVMRWEYRGLPYTEFSGETRHSKIIERLTKKEVNVSQLLKWTIFIKRRRKLKAA